MPILRNWWQRCLKAVSPIPEDLHNRVIALQLDNYPQLQLCFTAGGLKWLRFDGTAELTVSGPSGAFLNYLFHQNANLAVSRGLQLSGSLEIAELLQKSLKRNPRALDALFSRILHPWLSYPLAQGLHQVIQRTKATTTRLVQTQFDYWHYETEQLATHPEIEHFIQAVDELNLACERAHLRLSLYDSHARSPA